VDAQTVEDVLAGLPVELLHAALVLLALVRELLGKGSVAPRKCHVAPLKAPGHGIALLDGLAAEVGIVYRGRLLDRGLVAAEEAVESFEEAEHVEGLRGRAGLLSLPLPCIFSFYCLFSQSSMQARSPKATSATRAIIVSRQAPISSGATVLRLPIVQTRASASPRAAERTTFLLAMPKAPMKYPTNAPGASSAQTRVPVVKPFLLSAASAN